MHDFTIREATAQDCAVILELIRELAQFEKLEHEVTTDVETLKNSLFNTSRPHAFVLLAEAGESIVGFCAYFYNFSTFLGRPGLYIEDIYIRPSFRQHGLGTSFFKKIADIATRQNCGRIEWWVLDWNTRAIDFYAALGAEAMAEWTVYRLSEDKFAALR